MNTSVVYVLAVMNLGPHSLQTHFEAISAFATSEMCNYALNQIKPKAKEVWICRPVEQDKE